MTDSEIDVEAIERALRRGAGAARNDNAMRDGAPTRADPASDRRTAAKAAERLGARIAAENLADVTYAPIDSPFGRLLAATTGQGLVRLAFPEEEVDSVLEGLARRISPRIIEASAPLDRTRRELEEYFGGRRRMFELPLDWSLIGTFGQRVLKATAAIPYGDVLTYGEVATDAGSPRGSRAAGNALGSNPIPIVIPCHRVLRRGGVLGGYAGGPERKRWLLDLEGALKGGG